MSAGEGSPRLFLHLFEEKAKVVANYNIKDLLSVSGRLSWFARN